ncbi:EAL domain-containing protein [Bhargavaea ginsengi]|uniref:EAL domain-containing protein n=1 Tax=Bhargavaea ginsengi TaxID=426757 RepID=UPI00203D6F1B|nr:EAL domain-containing protein [Bhargavaea ginsengi]
MNDQSRYRQLANLTRIINTKLDLKEMLQAVTDAISQEVFQCDSVGIYLPQEDGTFRGFTGKPEVLNGMTLDMHVISPEDDALVREVTKTNRAVYIPDTRSDGRPSDWAVDSFLIRSLLAMPIAFGDDLYGLVFLFNYGQPMNITGEQRETVEAFVNMAAVAIRNANDLLRKENLIQDKQLLLDANSELSRAETMDQAIQTCFRHVGQLLESDDPAVHLLDPVAGKKIKPAHLAKSSDMSEDEWLRMHRAQLNDLLEDRMYQDSIRTRKPVYIPDVTKDERPNKDICRTFGIRGMAIFPMIAMNEILGFIAVPNRSGKIVEYPQTTIDLAQSIVDMTASTLSNLLFIEKQEMIINQRTKEVTVKNEELQRVITELESLSREKELILKSAGEGIFGIGLDGKVTFSNPAALKMLGYSRPEELEGQSSANIFRGGDSGELPQLNDESDVFHRKDGTVFPVEYDISFIQEDDQIFGQVVIFKDITERRYLEEEIKYYAYYDSLTDLPNRLQMKERLDEALENAKRDDEQVAVMFLDLDRFKLVNDTLGHSFGDLLLKEVAKRLSEAVPINGIVSRQGGDEFMIILLDVKNREEVLRAVSKINKSFAKPITIDDHEIFIKNSIGISMFPADGDNAEMLIKNADTAMYHSKEVAGGSYYFYDEKIGKRTIESVKYENALYRALERDEFTLYYQPQVDLCKHRMVGVEALIRWNHPEEGLVSPDIFIPLAEQTGLIVPIGEWVLREAVSQLKKWHDKGFDDLCMAVNLSAAQFEQGSLHRIVKQVLAETGIRPELLHLELTENQIMRNTDLAISTMNKLKELGVHLDIDDFGTGYSSLGYLQRFPLTTLKIDRTFIRDILLDEDDRALTDTIITMAKNMGLEVIAEGVETEEQADYLASHECTMMQGYFFSPPVPARKLEKDFLTNDQGGWSR